MQKISEVGWRVKVDSRESKTTVCKECVQVSEASEVASVVCFVCSNLGALRINLAA